MPADIAQLLQAGLTPLVAVITTYIAYQQYRIRKDERALQLYDRRLALFNKAIEIIDKVRSGHMFKPEDAFSWLTPLNEACFVFGEEVDVVISHLFSDVYIFAAECEKGDFTIEAANAALRIEAYRTPLIETFRHYMRVPGSPVTRRKRLTIKEAEDLIRRGMGDGMLPSEREQGDIPF